MMGFNIKPVTERFGLFPIMYHEQQEIARFQVESRHEETCFSHMRIIKVQINICCSLLR